MSNKLFFIVKELNKPSQEAILRLNETIYNYVFEDELEGKLNDKLKRNSSDITEKTA